MLRSQNFAMKIPWPMMVLRQVNSKKAVTVLAFFALGFPIANFQAVKDSENVVPDPVDAKLVTDQCPKLVPCFFDSVMPAGQNDKSKLVYDKQDGVVNRDDCVKSCCTDESCQVVFTFLNNSMLTCYHVSCTKDDFCLPAKPISAQVAEKVKDKSSLVLVRPKGDAWNVECAKKPTGQSEVEQNGERMAHGRACEVGLDMEECKANEICKPSASKSRGGICKCKGGYENKGPDGDCVPVEKPVTKVVVEVQSKNIVLPNNKAVLTAFAIPEPQPGKNYEYEWKLLSDQVGGIMGNSHDQALTVSGLIEGTYKFQVTVSGGEPPVYGIGYGNINVLPPTRVNSPPKAIVQPPKQTITLPSRKAIVDASSSTDDTHGLKYKWEIISSPLGYNTDLPNEATLTLVDLLAGNLTLKLTVTDQDGASDSTVASVLVLEETDYPPSANAGEDIIIHLPNNEVTLNGRQSIDDHGIVSWEWVRSGGDELAADTKNMRTPNPTISNLEEGVYTFNLKVTDAKGQTGEQDVNVYVKPPINLPPVANAGKNQSISLPRSWVTLDGSGSSDDLGIKKWSWAQVEGPNQASIANASSAVANVTGLTKGDYLFNLTIQDGDGNNKSSVVAVKVSQDTNSPPVAEAGDDVEVTLPQSVVLINGSLSHDDLRIAKWQWTRNPKSLAVGKVVGNSSKEAVLYLVNLVPGKYIFDLKVWDDQGKSSEDSISIIVKTDVNQMNVIQAVLEVNITSFTQNDLTSFCQSMDLLLRSDSETEAKVKVLNVLPQQDTNYVILEFLVELTDSQGQKRVMRGVKAVEELRSKLTAGGDILDLKLVSLDTLVCQNDCSGHGHCQRETRACICESFWIENFVRKHLMDGKSNCEWSVIYVGIFLSVLILSSACGIIYLSCKKKRRGENRPKRRYTRLNQNDQSFEMRNAHTSSLMVSDTDSEDDEIVFTDDINRQSHRSRNGLNKRNGYANNAEQEAVA